MYAIAVILDPRLKMSYYKRCKWHRSLVAHAKGALQQAAEVYGAAPPQPDVADDSVRMDKWPYKKLKRCPINPKSELDKYLTGSVVSEDEDALGWWKHNADEYPCLARIARDYLAIPATSVPSERAFSSGANLISDKRWSLDDTTIQACLCLKSWLS
jgi:hAT family C-terminal dimerisation region